MTVAAGPVIPNFGTGSSCVTGDHDVLLGLGAASTGATRSSRRSSQHVELTAIAVAIGFALAFAARAARAPLPARSSSRSAIVSALLYTIPSLALFQILVPFTGITTTTVEIALVAYTLVILFPNIVAGLRSGAARRARGGARHGPDAPRRCCARVELPLAVPAIIGGLRIAVVSTVAIAHDRRVARCRRDSATRSSLALKQPTPFKTEIYSAGVLAVGLALACDGAARRCCAGCSSRGRGGRRDARRHRQSRTRSSKRCASSATTRRFLLTKALQQLELVGRRARHRARDRAAARHRARPLPPRLGDRDRRVDLRPRRCRASC